MKQPYSTDLNSLLSTKSKVRHIERMATEEKSKSTPSMTEKGEETAPSKMAIQTRRVDDTQPKLRMMQTGMRY